MPIARSSLAELEAAIARAEIRLARRHLVLVLRAAAGLDTTRAEAKLRRARAARRLAGATVSVPSLPAGMGRGLWLGNFDSGQARSGAPGHGQRQGLQRFVAIP